MTIQDCDFVCWGHKEETPTPGDDPAVSLSLSVPTWAQVLFPANGVVQLLVAPERRAVYVLSRLAARQVEAQDSEMDGEEIITAAAVGAKNNV